MIEENVKEILQELPEGVRLVAAAKSRTPEEVLRATKAGIEIIGENYVQETLEAYKVIGPHVKWHFIGHLQRNKVKKAVEIFDVIETVDGPEIAFEIDRRASYTGKVMEVFIEINSGREKQKFGVLPEDAEALVKEVAQLKHVRLRGVMTMGPLFGNPEDSRPYFVETRKVFHHIGLLNLPNVEMKYLSMGMSHSYRVAIEEGANIIRIGTKIFGPRRT